MKKFLLILILLFIGLTTYADEIKYARINFDIKEDPQVVNQYESIQYLFQNAKEKNDHRLYIKACKEALKIQPEGNPEKIKEIRDLITAILIDNAGEAYFLYKDKKYLKTSYKYSKLAIKERTDQEYSIQIAILLAAEYLDKKGMEKAYDLYREKYPRQAEEFYNVYEQRQELVSYAKQNLKKQRITKYIVNPLQIFGAILSISGQAMQEYERNQAINHALYNQNNTNITTHCYRYGNQTNCHSY